MELSTFRAISRFVNPFAKMPSYVLLFVTSRCQASCGHCFYWRRTNQPEEELTLAEIERLAHSLGNVLQVTITGGSAEMRDDCAEIIVTISKICKPVNITFSSNGNQPDRLKTIVQKVLSQAPDQALTVDVSLDGLSGEHDTYRNLPGLFENVCESFTLLAGIKKNHPRLRLGVGLCISGLNQHSAEKTALWAIENLPIDNLTPILVRGETRNPGAASANPEVFLKIATIVEEKLLKNKFSGYASFPLIINAKDIIQKKLIAKIAREKKSPLRCSALRETVVVYPDGTIPGCELKDDRIGSLREVNMDIRKIYMSANARQFREKCSHGKCYCWHQCFLSASIVKSPVMWPELLSTIKDLKKR